MVKSYDNGVRDATLKDLRGDIAEIKSMLTGWQTLCRKQCRWTSVNVTVNRATIGLAVVAIGFLYVACIRGWF